MDDGVGAFQQGGKLGGGIERRDVQFHPRRDVRMAASQGNDGVALLGQRRNEVARDETMRAENDDASLFHGVGLPQSAWYWRT